MSRVVTWAAAAASLVLAGAPAGAQSADSAIDHAVAAWSGVRTIRARFEQQVTNALTGSSAASHGEFEQERPNHLSIVFTDLDGDRIVADGRYIWVYLPSSTPGQVLRHPAADADAVPIDPSAEFLATPHTRFVITGGGHEVVDGVGTTTVILVPREGVRVPFTRAQVWIGDRDGLIHRFETAEANGVTRRVELSGLVVNGPVDHSAFTFTPPKGVKVVDQGSP